MTWIAPRWQSPQKMWETDEGLLAKYIQVEWMIWEQSVLIGTLRLLWLFVSFLIKRPPVCFSSSPRASEHKNETAPTPNIRFTIPYMKGFKVVRGWELLTRSSISHYKNSTFSKARSYPWERFKNKPLLLALLDQQRSHYGWVMCYEGILNYQ